MNKHQKLIIFYALALVVLVLFEALEAGAAKLVLALGLAAIILQTITSARRK